MPSTDLIVLHLCELYFFNTEKWHPRGVYRSRPLAVSHRLLCSGRRSVGPYLRSINAPPTSFLCAVGPQFLPISSSVVTSLLRRACTSLGNPAGFSSADISAKSLRASGAMALLNSMSTKILSNSLTAGALTPASAIYTYKHKTSCKVSPPVCSKAVPILSSPLLPLQLLPFFGKFIPKQHYKKTHTSRLHRPSPLPHSGFPSFSFGSHWPAQRSPPFFWGPYACNRTTWVPDLGTLCLISKLRVWRTLVKDQLKTPTLNYEFRKLLRDDL
jgi:hypothetical protein